MVLVVFYSSLRDLLASVLWRVRCGTPIRFGSFELGGAYVSPTGDISQDAAHIESMPDEDNARLNERDQYYRPSRRIFLVHKLSVSRKSGQLYDIQIYLIPHKDATLACVERVEYYFGHYWGNKIFVSRDRSLAFSVSTSAYGPFVTTAKVYFTDGPSVMLSRYIDFEMGPAGPQPLMGDVIKK